MTSNQVHRICPHCGAAYAVEATVCPDCGRAADESIAPSVRQTLPLMLARVAAPVALGVATLAARAGLALVRSMLTRALAPKPPVHHPAEPAPKSPRATVRLWQRREVWDASGRRFREETRAQWEIHQ